jgi:hypothetical protein
VQQIPAIMELFDINCKCVTFDDQLKIYLIEDSEADRMDKLHSFLNMSFYRDRCWFFEKRIQEFNSKFGYIFCNEHRNYIKNLLYKNCNLKNQ